MKAFISYSHKDAAFLDRFHSHLATLKREGVIDLWYDGKIEAGTGIDDAVSQNLEDSEVFIPLVTPDFLASDYCVEVEMKRAFEKYSDGSVRIVPLIMEPCDWVSTPLRQLKALPRDGKPVSKWDNQNDAYLDIVKGLRALLGQKSDQMDRTSSADLMDETPIPVTLEVDENFDEFSEQRKQKFLKTLEVILQAEGEVKIKRVRQGSVLIDLNLSRSAAKKLSELPPEDLQRLKIKKIDFARRELNPEAQNSIRERVLHVLDALSRSGLEVRGEKVRNSSLEELLNILNGWRTRIGLPRTTELVALRKNLSKPSRQFLRQLTDALDLSAFGLGQSIWTQTTSEFEASLRQIVDTNLIGELLASPKDDKVLKLAVRHPYGVSTSDHITIGDRGIPSVVLHQAETSVKPILQLEYDAYVRIFAYEDGVFLGLNNLLGIPMQRFKRGIHELSSIELSKVLPRTILLTFVSEEYIFSSWPEDEIGASPTPVIDMLNPLHNFLKVPRGSRSFCANEIIVYQN